MAQVNKELPAGAHCAYHGVIYDVWQWEQTLFDGSTGIFERLVRPDSTQVIAVVQNRIILQEQLQPGWAEVGITLPGGRVEEGESPLQGAKRELREEAGIESDDWELVQEFTPSSHFFWTVHTFVARSCRKITEPCLDAGEQIREIPVTFEELLTYSENPAFRNHDIKPLLVRARYDESYRRQFYTLLFSKNFSDPHHT